MDRPLHILHVFSTFKVAGPQVRFLDLVQGFGNLFSHTIIAMDGNYGAARLLAPQVRAECAEAPTSAGSMMNRLSRYRRDIRAHAPDLLVTYNWGAIEWTLANAAIGVPHIHIEDGFGPEEANQQLARRVWTRRLALWRSGVIVPSLALQNIALNVWHLGKSQVTYIPNGVEPRDSYRTDISSLELNLPPDLPRIAFAGELRPEKNPLRLLHAYEPLKAEAVLLMMGDGPQAEMVRAEAGKLGLGANFHILGRRGDVRDILMQSDILALSSDTEQMPLAVMEGMDAGLAVASTDVGDVRHMVCEENLHYLAERSDAALGSSLRELVRNPTVRRAIGAANRKRVRQNYQVRDMVAAYRTQFLKKTGLRETGLKSCA